MHFYKRMFKYVISMLSGWFLLQLCACTTYYYEYPQPADVKNTYQFPKSFQGTWDNVAEKNAGTTITIGKNFLSMSVKPRKIYNGLLDSAGLVKYLLYKKIRYDSLNQPIDTVDDVISKTYEGLSHIVYDEQKIATDTVEDYIIKDNKIYPMTGSDNYKSPHPGYPFMIKDDTIYLNVTDRSRESRLNLSPDNFLRKVSKDRYILNLRQDNFQSVYHDDGLGLLWQIILIELTPEGFLNMGVPTYSQQKEMLSIVYHRKDEYYYLNNQWTRDEFIRIIENEKYSSEPIFELKRKKDKQ